jgi:hypothetical protein
MDDPRRNHASTHSLEYKSRERDQANRRYLGDPTLDLECRRERPSLDKPNN